MSIFIDNPRRGGGGLGSGRGAGRVSAANLGMGGGGLNILFRGPNVHRVNVFGINIDFIFAPTVLEGDSFVHSGTNSYFRTIRCGNSQVFGTVVLTAKMFLEN